MGIKDSGVCETNGTESVGFYGFTTENTHKVADFE